MLIALGIPFVIENPVSSIIWEYTALKNALAKTRTVRVVCQLGRFGAQTLKPVVHRGSWDVWPDLRRRNITIPIQRAHLRTCTRKEGRWVQQIGDALHASQEYPERFCETVAEFYKLQWGKRDEPLFPTRVVDGLGRYFKYIKKGPRSTSTRRGRSRPLQRRPRPPRHRWRAARSLPHLQPRQPMT